MFHVMLVAPILGLMAVYGVIVLVILSVPFCVGMFLQLVLTVFGQKHWVLWVPTGLGALGLAGSLAFFLPDVPVSYILVYWVLYFLALWLTWLVVDQIKKFIARRRHKE